MEFGMTDEQMFLSMCQRFGLRPEKNERGLGAEYIDEFGTPAVSYTLEQGHAERQIGYNGFGADWHFDDAGKFLVVGFWE